MTRPAGVYRWPRSRLRWWRDPTFPTMPTEQLLAACRAIATCADRDRPRVIADAVHWLAPFIAAGQLFKPDVVDALLDAAIARGIERADAEAIVGNTFVEIAKKGNRPWAASPSEAVQPVPALAPCQRGVRDD